VIRVVDGDTCVVDLDLGCHVTLKDRRIRLLKCWAPELSEPDGEAAKEALTNLVLTKHVIVRTELDKSDSFGRLLGELFIETSGAWESVNALLVRRGLATEARL